MRQINKLIWKGMRLRRDYVHLNYSKFKLLLRAMRELRSFFLFFFHSDQTSGPTQPCSRFAFAHIKPTIVVRFTGHRVTATLCRLRTAPRQFQN